MVVLLGGSGYVGKAFRALFKTKKVPYQSWARSEVDYTDKSILAAALKKHKPAFLVNCSGYTGKPNVDACELHKAECLFGNAVFPGYVAEVCADLNIPWGHVSSGCIYSGRKADGSAFTEEDAPNFSFRSNYCSFYSGSKALGEETLAGKSNIYIWRLRIPFNEIDGPRNYLTKVMSYAKLLEAENSLSQLDEFVAAAWQCHEKAVPFGIYNLTNPGSMTTSEVVELVVQSGVIKKDFQFFNSEDDFMKTAAKTPRSNCVLDTTKAKSVGIIMSPVREAVQTALARWKKNV
ncbi:MAG: sugar nucleotide-binding protein [Verrucomicrobiota bacterium]|nr:sugar nucleotide-binding protein [Verrucomicrobiota bacterium]